MISSCAPRPKDVISGASSAYGCGNGFNGRIALERIDQFKPTWWCSTLKCGNGWAGNSRRVTQKTRRLPVICFSTLTHRGATATLDALTLGADDYVPKRETRLD